MKPKKGKGNNNLLSFEIAVALAVLLICGGTYAIFGGGGLQRVAAVVAGLGQPSGGRANFESQIEVLGAGKSEEKAKSPEEAKKAEETAKKAEEEAKAAAKKAEEEEKAKAEAAAQAVSQQNLSILIKKDEFLLYLLDANGKPLKTYPCATGKSPGQKEKRGDMKTPTGVFKIDEILDSSSWSHDFGDGKGEIPRAYGPWFISLDTKKLSGGKWDGIGIHGTHDPASLGHRATEGCIRLQNEAVAELRKYVYIGMEVTIVE